MMKYKYTLYYSILGKVYSKVYIPNIFIYLYLKYRYNYISKFKKSLSPKVLPDTYHTYLSMTIAIIELLVALFVLPSLVLV